MSDQLPDVVAQTICDERWGVDGETHQPTGWDRGTAEAVLARLDGRLFTSEDARLMRLAIDWIASELRDQEIAAGEYVGTRTFLNEMITRFDQYAALVGSETPWVIS